MGVKICRLQILTSHNYTTVKNEAMIDYADDMNGLKCEKNDECKQQTND